MGEISVTEVNEWWKKIGTYDSRNQEGFRVDGGTVWTEEEEGQIVEDKFFYIPDDFSWLGNGFKNVKSLVSGIGLKITSVVGPKFTKDMRGINFEQVRRVARSTARKGGTPTLSRKVGLERVAYYKPNGGGQVLEMGEEVCVLNRKVNGQDVFLFVGFAEVAKGAGYGGGHKWNFQEKGFFKNVGGCSVLRGWMKGSPRLIREKIGNGGDAIQGNEVIVLGQRGIGEGVIQLSETKDGKPLIGMLLGLAMNIAQGKECNGKFVGPQKSEKTTKGEKDEEKKLKRAWKKKEKKLKKS